MGTAVYLEVAAKRVFACAVEWPGWCRAGRDEDAALAAFVAYADRYAAVLEEAGVARPHAFDRVEVVERVKGGAGTEFGVPSEPCGPDQRPLRPADARRLAALVGAAWQVFDGVVAAAPAALRKGPRGGGRDRDQIVAHVDEAEQAYFGKVSLRGATRSAFASALASARAPVPEPTSARAKPWPWRYAARRVAWHALDHAWEIEDRSTG